MAKNRFTIIRLPEKSNNVDGIVSEKQEAHMYPSSGNNADDDESSDDENTSSIGNETPDDDDDDSAS